MSALQLLAALLMGLLGSAHCIVMCGGVVAMTCSALPLAQRSRFVHQVPYLIAYNAGRIASYSAAGGLAGLIGATFASWAPLEGGQTVVRLGARLMLVAVGLYVAGVAPALRWIEGLGKPVWDRIAPIARRWVPVRRPVQAFALGLVWGWMPCGLVYGALAAAAGSGSLGGGAATMAAFGTGTLPMLLTMGSAGALLARLARHRWVRGAAGVAMIAFGVVQIAQEGAHWGAMRGGGAGGSTCCAAHRHG